MKYDFQAIEKKAVRELKQILQELFQKKKFQKEQQRRREWNW